MYISQQNILINICHSNSDPHLVNGPGPKRIVCFGRGLVYLQVTIKRKRCSFHNVPATSVFLCEIINIMHAS